MDTTNLLALPELYTTLKFIAPPSKVRQFFAVTEREDAPECELRIKQYTADLREMEITTRTADADYFLTRIS